MQGQPRKLALVAPENAEYQESVNLYLDLLGQAGISVALNLKYKLDISSMPNQASNNVAQLKDNGITTVLCVRDPLRPASGIQPMANAQNHGPKWPTHRLT